MIYIYPNTLSTFQGKRETALNAGYVEITDEVYNDLVETKLKWENGKVVQDTTYDARKEQERQEKLANDKKQALANEIASKKQLLLKYREDVEQVDLFGMERADYEQKKALCKQLVEELRELEGLKKLL